MICAPICVKKLSAQNLGSRGTTDCGARPKIRAEKSSDMTPKKKDNFSRVRTTFADCHELASVVIRVEIYSSQYLGIEATYDAHL
jgi:hypothetical protein